MAKWEQLNFQNSFSPNMEQLMFLHDHIVSILILIMSSVTYTIILLMVNHNTMVKSKDNHQLEVVWALLPGVVLLLVALPSLRLLYSSEEMKESPLALKTLGHQWYWSYEYSGFKEMEFDSFMLPLEKNIFRLLETDNSLVLPEKTYIQMFTSSTDVLHSWTIPAMGVKADSSPGRLNTINLFSNKTGQYYGQCSEICGANHSFMPITLTISNFEYFKKWMMNSNLTSSL